MKALLPIVGSAFRPPATKVIASLPFDTPIILEREPENPHDEKAIKVLLPGFSAIGTHKDLYQEALSEAIPDEADLSRGQWHVSSLSDPLHLGYIGKKTGHAPLMAEFIDEEGDISCKAALSSLPSGNPAALVDVPLDLAKKLEVL